MEIIDLNEAQVEDIETRLSLFDENYITYKMDGRIQIGVEEDGRLIAGLDACITAFRILYVSTVFVDQEYRRQGIAKQMLKDLLERGRRLGAEEFTLEVRINNTPAIKLYEGLGFVNEGIRPGFYNNPKEDARIYWLYTT